MSTIRLCLVTDIHHGDNHVTKKGQSALPLLEQFTQFVKTNKPDAVIDLGDRISDVDHDTDYRLEQEVAQVFSLIDEPVFHICGNHDRDHLTVAENETIFSQSLGHRVIDMGAWDLVLWCADARIHRPGGFILPESDLIWLAGIINTATKPLAIFSHVPLSEHSVAGNYYFERNPAVATYPGSIARIKAVLATANVPVACIAGHVHWNTLTMVGGQAHFTLQSLTESFTTYPEPAGSYGMLELNDRVTWTVHGKDSFHASLNTADLRRNWLTPMPAFHKMPENRHRHPEPVGE